MVSLTAGQKATLSPEAIKFLNNVPNFPFSNFLSPFLASSGRIKGLRENMAAKTSPVEEALIQKHNLKITEATIANMPVIIIEPPAIKLGNERKILLNFFGGGFVMGSARERAALLMAAEMGIRVYSVAYSKSPEVRYPVARDEGLAVYRELLRTFDPSGIFGMASSSGAQILLSMLLAARQENLPMPARLGAGDTTVCNDGRDIMPAALVSAMVTQNYKPVGIDATDALYSPIYAEHESDFPPSVISVGTRNVCLSHGVRMYWKLREAGVKAELLVSEGMWHGFNWDETLPKAVRVRAAVRDFLQMNF
ncbi:alpha/beta-hydrolase [Rhizodiscina lignyota]|uniref:Alpha/beta-hydrolase n=1 Tax=Rhizodiscina lignyota TaxID=1504668 RepID=A0A9P4I6Y2_9PEZI|nr:alpha/beta-hydrolase [Rhizodiscina lignyota]